MTTGVERVEAGGTEPSQRALDRLRAYLRVFAELSPNARRLLLATMCIWIAVGISGVIFNLYLLAVGHNVAFVGLLAAVTTVGQAAMSPAMGWLLRRYTARAVMAGGTAVLVLASVTSAVIVHAGVLVISSAIAGLAVSAATIPSSPYMMEHSTARQRSHLFAAYMASSNIGSMIGSLLSGVVPAIGALVPALHGNIVMMDRIALLVGAAIMSLGIWLFWSMRPEQPSADSADRPGLPSPDSAPPDESETRRDVLAMMAATALIALALGAIYPFFNVYFSSRLHASTATIGFIYALSGVLCTCAAFAAPAIARWGTLNALSATRILSAPLFLLLWLHPGLALAAAAYIGRNILGTMTGTHENTFSMEVSPARLRGMVASWRTFAFNAGWTVSSLVAGLIVARYGFDVVFIASGVLTAAGVAVWRVRFARRG